MKSNTQQVVKIASDGRVIDLYRTVEDAAYYNTCSAMAIRRRCRRITTRNDLLFDEIDRVWFTFRYADDKEPFKDNGRDVYSDRGHVQKIRLSDGAVLADYKNYAEAARHETECPATIWNHCAGVINPMRTNKDYTFRWVEDKADPVP